MTLFKFKRAAEDRPKIAIIAAQSSDYASAKDKMAFQDPERRPFNKYVVSPQFEAAVSAAGGMPLFIGYDAKWLEDAARFFDGFVITGADTGLPKEWYIDGEKSPHPATGRVDFERRLIDEFVKAGKPGIGICHGSQVFACHLTGAKMTADIHAFNSSSTQNIIHRHSDAPKPKLSHHNIQINKSTISGHILHMPRGVLRVNSHHNEGVVIPGSNLVVSAQADDGTVEMTEAKMDLPGGQQSFYVGMQWHQEFEGPRHPGYAIVRAFVQRARDPDLAFEPAA